MMRKGELHYAKNPHHSYLKWALFWVLTLVFFFAGSYILLDRIQTHAVPVGKLELRVPYSRYNLGEDIYFSLTNKYNGTIYVSNNCPSEPLMVYKLTAGKWVRIHDKAEAEECPDQDRQIALPPNAVVTDSFAKWDNLFSTPGKYRIVAFVEYYDDLPFADFEIVDIAAATQLDAKPATPIASSATVTKAKSGKASASSGSNIVATGTSGSSSVSSSVASPTPTPPAPSPPPSPPPAPKTVVVQVSSAGNYNVTSLNLNVGDTIQFTYSAPIGSELRTRFTRQNGTTATISSVTLDDEHTSRTRTVTAAGTWTYKVDDKSGNTGTLTVK